MDSSNIRVLSTLLVKLTDHALTFWHGSRLVVFLLGTVVACLIFVRRWGRSEITTHSASPAAEEKAAWLTDPDSRGFSDKNTQEKVTSISTKTDADGARRSRPVATRVVTGRKPNIRNKSNPEKQTHRTIRPLIFFSSLTGTTKKLADEVEEQVKKTADDSGKIAQPAVHDLSYIDLDDYFVSGPKTEKDQSSGAYFYILLIPSYDIDTILTNFLEHLKETHHDFRIDTGSLAGLAGYSVFGIGDKEGWPDEASGFCQQAFETDKWMAKLTSRKRAYPLGLGDVKSNVKESLTEWTSGLCETLLEISSTGFLGEGVPGSGDPVESDDEELADEDEFPDSGRQKRRKIATNLTDLEDVGGQKTGSIPLAVDFTTYSDPNVQPTLKPMVPKSSPTYAALTKQGYTIVGSHSGVKICRWTKSALRGRGSCYKNSFYGIASHLCMETTPSLSCSNKCVFCWRHGTNPVSTTWRWEVDDPKMIFEGAKAGHYQKIKMMRGVPGVRADRFEEAMRIRHCALSLVGEPIFYPRINEYLDLLHGERISTFLVCNAQHPLQLRDLTRVTQLYVSIDASNKDSLRKIDRPLHRDFWERFQSCLDILKTKRFVQRTVFRLTLVKGFNMADEVAGYADLIEKALPCFIEVKGVTFCGTSTSSSAGLTMQNVPFYEEVIAFAESLNETLAARGLDKIDGGFGYGIGAEHAHSCCILLASKRFLRDGKWCTRIDYPRFFDLLEREKTTGQSFGPEDYCRETETWALWGNGGFDPRDERVDRKGRPKAGGTRQQLKDASVQGGKGEVVSVKELKTPSSNVVEI